MTDRQRAGAPPPFRLGADWWRRGVVYQIYPRSFADSDGDGDRRPAGPHRPPRPPRPRRARASTPSGCRRSIRRPGRDGGYDVSDHTAIDPLFGSEAQFDRLVDEAHRRGIRVIMDLVLNHTSDEHPWFVGLRRVAVRRRTPTGTCGATRPASIRAGRPLPPNDWVSWFGGPAWTYEPRRGQFYHHTFLAEQPDLDWRQPAVETAQHDVVRAWIARGVDGFRLDTFNVYLKHPDMPSNPTRRGSTAWDRQVHIYDIDQPDLPELLARFRAVVDAAPGRMTVGEMFVGTTEGAAALTTDRHLVFDWELLTRPWSAAAFAVGDPPPRAGVRTRTAGRPSSCRTTTSRARPRASRRRSRAGRPTATPIAKAAAVLLADDARDAVPLLRRGDRDGRRRRAGRRERRSRGPARQRRLPLVGSIAVAHADAVDGGTRGRVHDRSPVAAARAGHRARGTSRARPPTRTRSSPAIGDCSASGPRRRRSRMARSRWSGPAARTSSRTVAGGAGPRC